MLAALATAARAGDRRALARLLSRVEFGGDAAEAALEQLYQHAGQAHVVGITGAPGTGKSTLAGCLAREWRRRAQTVAILAVDPSSPYTGGALLGDRVRLSDLSGDAGVFVRSLASRGAGGGLAEAASAMVTVLDAAGFDRVLVETVGAGQGELEIAGEAQTTIVVTAPGLGDEVQALKSGIVEIADVLVVNKADRDGADRAAAELAFAATPAEGWTPPVLQTIATSGEGVAALADVLDEHRRWLQENDTGARARALAEHRIVRAAAAYLLREVRQQARQSGQFETLAGQVASRRLSPLVAARMLLSRKKRSGRNGEH
jgi:LAO/AO transport system kinase